MVSTHRVAVAAQVMVAVALGEGWVKYAAASIPQYGVYGTEGDKADVAYNVESR